MKRGTEHQPFEDEQGLLVAYVMLHSKKKKKTSTQRRIASAKP